METIKIDEQKFSELSYTVYGLSPEELENHQITYLKTLYYAIEEAEKELG